MKTLADLSIGHHLVVEISFGESRIEFESTVTGIDVHGVYIKPYVYKDVVIDFNTLPYKNLLFNVHHIDESGARNTWKNVGVSVLKHKGQLEYLVTTKTFSKFAESGERRENNRIKLTGSGFVENNLGKRFQCTLNDISDSGISFFSNPGEITVADYLTVFFFDVAKDTEFSLKLKVRIVRVEERERGTLYAGRILSPPRELLAYIVMKRMEQKATETMYKY